MYYSTETWYKNPISIKSSNFEENCYFETSIMNVHNEIFYNVWQTSIYTDENDQEHEKRKIILGV